jgi:hypothetical protein
MNVSDNKTGEPAPDTRDRGHRVPAWVNWVLALLTAPGAALVVIFALGAVMSVAACSTVECPDLGPSGFLFTVLYYGAPVVAGVTIFVSFFTANRRRGIIVPLCGWGLLVADVAVLAITFNS